MPEKYYDYENIKLNLGCGNKPRPDFLNLDIKPEPGVDIVWDLNKGIPLKNNSVIEIWASHILEHFENSVPIMEEIWRVCKPNAFVRIKTPYFKSIGAFKDPTHRSFFTEETFYYFNKNERKKRDLPNYTNANFQIIKIDYIWSAPWLSFLPFKKRFFLKHFWNIARTIYFELQVIK